MAIFRHKHTKVCPTSSLVKLAVDAMGDARGQPVACVLMDEADVAIFHHEVATTSGIPTNKLAAPAAPTDFWDDDQGKLWLMTYAQLSALVAVPNVGPKDDLTFLLHLGCGDYTWDTVKGCHDLWNWAQGFDVGFQKPMVWVYTVSNVEESIFRDAPAARLDLVGIKGPRLEWRQPEAFSAAVAQVQQENAAWVELCRNTPDVQPRPSHTNRAVIFAPEEKLLEAYETNGSLPPVRHVTLKGRMTGEHLAQWVSLLRQGQYDTKALVVRPDVCTIGTVRNLGTALVLPVREGWFFDRRISRVVFRKDMPMSQAEVRHACRVACLPDVSPVVHIFTTKDGFARLPMTPASPRAFTGDLPAVLLHFCGHSYFDGARRSPIRLPGDEQMVTEYLRRLRCRGLTEGRGGPPTHVGRLTDWWYQHGIRDSGVANLLAIAWTAKGDRAGALMQVAALSYEPDPLVMSPLSSLLRFRAPECKSGRFQSLLAYEVQGFAQTYAARGPIWVAMGIWASRWAVMSAMDTSDAADTSICDDMLVVSQRELSKIKKNWDAMSLAWTRDLGGSEVSRRPAINPQDFLFLEESIVRAWMHNLALVCTQDAQLGTFGVDLTSECPIMAPVGDPVDWTRLAEEEDAEPPEGMPFTGVFAVYTALHRATGPDGKIQYIPETLTYVSTRAVRHVLKDVANSQAKNGYPGQKLQDVLRTTYPCHCEPGEGRLDSL